MLPTTMLCFRGTSFGARSLNRHGMCRKWGLKTLGSVQARCLTTDKAPDVVRIGCASGFWGDTPTAVPQLVNSGEIDYLVLDYLSEITMSLLVAAQQKNKDFGWCPDFVHSVGPLLGQIKKQGIKVVTNAGGINPLSCMEAVVQASKKVGADVKIAIIRGDDVLPHKDGLKGEGYPDPAHITSLNAYMGAGPIARALDLGADVVICGRCTDSALALGPLVHSFGWAWDDWDKIASGSLAGHLIECGAQATGGICTEWESVQGWEYNGFPIAVCQKDGDFTITKPKKTGGKVNKSTVAEQLLYEVDDPARYILPNSICDFSNVQMKEESENHVFVTGAKGLPPTAFYKIGGTYQDGWKCTSVCPIIGPKAAKKGVKTAEAILTRCRGIFQRMNLPDFTKTYVQILGSEQAYGANARQENLDTRDGALWLSVMHQERKALEIFAREIASAGTGMAPGLTAVIGGRPKPFPVLKFFSYLQKKENFDIIIEMSDGQEEVYKGTEVSTFTPLDKIASDYELEQASATKLAPRKCQLHEIAWTRSGDKGDTCNIGVIAKDPSDYEFLLQTLTADKVAHYFRHKFPEGQDPVCKRYKVPGISGLNFVLENSLGGGGIASLNADPQGKGYAQMLLDVELES